MSKLTLPYGGYVNGQRVNYTIDIDNRSLQNINGFTVQFIRIMTFSAFTPSCKTQVAKQVLFEEDFNTVCSRLCTQIFNGDFQISATAPSTEEGSMITVDYICKVILKLGSCADNKELIAKVIIGTKPLRETFSPISNSEAPLVVIPATAPSMREDYESRNQLPPSYREWGMIFPNIKKEENYKYLIKFFFRTTANL